jgi:hypothetical protein
MESTDIGSIFVMQRKYTQHPNSSLNKTTCDFLQTKGTLNNQTRPSYQTSLRTSSEFKSTNAATLSKLSPENLSTEVEEDLIRSSAEKPKAFVPVTIAPIKRMGPSLSFPDLALSTFPLLSIESTVIKNFTRNTNTMDKIRNKKAEVAKETKVSLDLFEVIVSNNLPKCLLILKYQLQ